MNKIEMLFFSVVLAMFALNAFDFIVYIAKPSPKTAYLTKFSWKIGFVCMIVLIYWFVNGYKFL